MTTAGRRRRNRPGWMAPRSGGYIPTKGVVQNPKRQEGGGVGNLRRHTLADRADSPRFTNGR